MIRQVVGLIFAGSFRSFRQIQNVVSNLKGNSKSSTILLQLLLLFHAIRSKPRSKETGDGEQLTRFAEYHAEVVPFRG